MPDKDTKKILQKAFPAGDLPFFVSSTICIPILLFAMRYESLILFTLGFMFTSVSLLYGVMWKIIHNIVSSRSFKIIEEKI